MNGLRPGQRVLYRDGDRHFVGRVDLVKERHITLFPFDPLKRDWSSKNRRVPISFVAGRVPGKADTLRLAQRIEQLRNQREALRQQANRWLEDSVRELVTP